MSFKKCKVVMLPANKKATDNNSPIFLYPDGKLLTSPMGNQHLYITSDDKIKENDWAILKVSDRRPLYCVKIKTINIQDKTCTVEFPYDNSTIEVFISGCKKVIATTDSSLFIPHGGDFGNNITKHLPQPSQAFIEVFVREYNKGNIITDVMVEYELEFHKWVKSYESSLGNSVKKLKVSKNNTITIKKVKDTLKDIMDKNPEVRNEIIELLYKHTEDMFKGKLTLEKWIAEDMFRRKSLINFKMSEEILIDPPSGWLYGFPKKIKSQKWESFNLEQKEQWLIKNNYPKKLIDHAKKMDAFHLRIINT